MKKAFFGVMMVSAVLCFLAGCVTSVPVTYTEPAILDLSGVKRIAVDSNDSRVAGSVSQRISATGRYTVASAAELAQWKLWQHQRQAAEVDSAVLVQAYNDNPASADSNYQRKLLRITSAVQQIQQQSGSYYVRFEGTGDNALAVFFRASELNRIRELRNGQTVTVIGECIGKNPSNTEFAQILQILGGGQAVIINDATFQVEAPAVDAVIVMEVNGDVQNGSRTEQEAVYDAGGRKRLTGPDGKPASRNVTVYERSATMNISYMGIRAQDLTPLGNGSASGESGKSSNQDQSKLPAGEQLLATAAEKALQEFNSAITPTQRSMSIALAKEADNAEAKKEMSAADQLVKAKDYAGAAAAYGAVYAKYKNFAAGYNQAVLTEVSSGTAAALGLMEAVAKANPGNPTAQATLRDMQGRNRANQRSSAQISS